MIDIARETDGFIEKIKASDVYKRFITARDEVNKRDQIRIQLDEYRKRSFEIQVGHNYGFYNSYEQLLQLQNQYEDLLAIPEVEEFLQAELELSKTTSGIIEKIAEEVDMNIEFLHES